MECFPEFLETGYFSFKGGKGKGQDFHHGMIKTSSSRDCGPGPSRLGIPKNSNIYVAADNRYPCVYALELMSIVRGDVAMSLGVVILTSQLHLFVRSACTPTLLFL